MIIIRSVLLGFGLAMDASAVSMANGLKEPNMKLNKLIFTAFLFGISQGLMPLIGYFISISFLFLFEKMIPWIALVILMFIGSNMIISGFDNEKVNNKITLKLLIVQALATSIDALSIGLAIANLNIFQAFFSSCIISFITFITCIISLLIGKKFGISLGNKAEILGGIVLIILGLEVFLSSFF